MKALLLGLMLTAGAMYAAMVVLYIVREETIVAAISAVVSLVYNIGAERIRKGD